MKLTQEQEAVIQCDLAPGQRLKVLAFAGTGKTTTLEAYTRQRPHLRFLYVAFNKSVQLEAAKRFPANVTARTAHALAFRAKGWPHRDRLVAGFKANQVMAALELHRYEDARFAQDTLFSYLVSADARVELRHVPAAAPNYYQGKGLPMPDLVGLANRLGRLMCTGTHPDIGMPHDGYLKLFQLSRPRLDYDCILLDEAQDINPVTADIVLSQIGSGQNRATDPESGPASSRTGPFPENPPALILVGDPHQQIYSFRGAGQWFRQFPADQTRCLTQSFRFDANVARVANLVLSRFKKEKKRLRGTPVPVKPPWDPACHTIIARTNAALFDRAVSLMDRHRIGFMGGFEGGRRLKDVYLLFDRQTDGITDPFLKGFSDYQGLKAYARVVEDMEVLALCRMVEKYTSRLPFLVDRVSEKAVDSGKADILLTTAHKAKGLEWPCVLLLDDFSPLVKDGVPVDPSGTSPDEFNLIYVAMTRARTHLRFARGSDIPGFIRHCLGSGK